jgi:hypothetical protein
LIREFENGKSYSEKELQGAYSQQIETNDVVYAIYRDLVAFTLNIFVACPQHATCIVDVSIEPPTGAALTFSLEGKFFMGIGTEAILRGASGKLFLPIYGYNPGEDELRRSVVTILKLAVTDQVSETTKQLRLRMG